MCLRNPRLACVLCFRVSHKAVIKVSAGAGAGGSPMPPLGKDPLPSSRVGWQGSVPVLCQLRVWVPYWLPSGPWQKGSFWRLPSVSCHMDLSIWQFTSLRPERGRINRGTLIAKIEVTILRIITTEVTFHYLCHILFIRSKSQALPTFRGMGLNNGMDTKKQGQLGATSESDCHKSPKQKEVRRDYWVVDFFLAHPGVFMSKNWHFKFRQII